MNSQPRNRFVSRAALSLAVGALVLTSGSVQAGPIPANLGAGLYPLVANRFIQQNPNSLFAREQVQQAATTEMATIADDLLRDEFGRVMVNVVLDGTSSYDTVRNAVGAIPGVTITAEDKSYRAGIIEGFVPDYALVDLAKTKGVVAVHGVNRPDHNVGAVTQQGVVQHRVDQLPANLDGTGITIGIISDSYNTAATFVTGGAPLTIREAQDIASCDLPGTANPCGNTQPVAVLKDFGNFPNASATDEGRGMAQLIHDMVPKARLGFATADDGEVQFANNIRALAGVQGLPSSLPGFAAQIIVDDVQYFDEGMFADTVIAQAVDDVTALGVSYFSSAGNTPPTQGYASDFRLVPAGPGATAGTNINLTNVPAAVYAGGFHNFRSDGGQDIAQTINLSSRQARIVMNWDDPYDTIPPTLGAVVFQGGGTLSAAQRTVDNLFNNPIAGKQYQVDVHGTSNSLNPGGELDVIVTIIQPDSTTLTIVDTGTSEKFSFFATQAGNYTVRVTGFQNDTGPFTVTINETSGQVLVTTDFNILFFRPDTGAFIPINGLPSTCVCENNFATNRPLELSPTITFPAGLTQVQMVIARSNTPNAPIPASRLRYKFINAATPAEYFSYNTPVTYGHNSAAGANGVAAYAPFQPNVPEDFTSSGPVRIVWDRNNQRIPDALQVRQKPNLAAMDGGNTTFFTSDTNRDLDAFPNFFGTSAAAPNAASVAALVLQAKGGPGSVSPAQMRTILQNSAFPHDLDPYSATGSAPILPNTGKIQITIAGDNSAQSRSDANGMSILYVGPSSISTLTLDGTNANPGGGNVTNPSTPGLLFDTRTAAAGGQPFVVGNGSVGLTAANVTAVGLNQAPAPATAGQFFKLQLTFTPGAFTTGKTLSFGVGRSFFRSAFAAPTGDSRAAQSADVAGTDILIPSGAIARGGITFTGTRADGSTFSGTISNQFGAGYSFLDGFGFINAQAAVNMPLPAP